MPLDDQLQRLAAFESSPFPVLSLYLDTRPDEHGRDHWQPFLRKEFSSRLKSYPASSEERQSVERDMQRIQDYLENQLQPSTNGLALFACAGENDFFEAVQLAMPVKESSFYVYHQPHLYPLALLNDEYPRYAAVVLDGRNARILVFGLQGVEDKEEVASGSTLRRLKVGGWSQARYQRRLENSQLAHAKEVVDVLDRIVREDGVRHILLAGDAVILPVFQEQLPPHLTAKVMDTVQLDMNAPEQEVLQTTLESLRQKDAQTDAEKVQQMLNQYRSGGLAVVGGEETLHALDNGQVDELIVTASPQQVEVSQKPAITEALESVNSPAAGEPEAAETRKELLADLLVTKAQQTGAQVTFIEDPALLSEVGGVGALLRYALPRARAVGLPD